MVELRGFGGLRVEAVGGKSIIGLFGVGDGRWSKSELRLLLHGLNERWVCREVRSRTANYEVYESNSPTKLSDFFW